MSSDNFLDLCAPPQGYNRLDDVPGLQPALDLDAIFKRGSSIESHDLDVLGDIEEIDDEQRRMLNRMGESARDVFRCDACKSICTDWSAQCPHCGRVGSVVQTFDTSLHRLNRCHPLAYFRAQELRRVQTGIPFWDEMLSGGFACGGTAVIGGEPYAGKSTMLLTIAHRANVHRSLYITAEEGLNSVALRARNLGISEAERNAGHAKTLVAQLEDTDDIKWMIFNRAPEFVVIDSINKISSRRINGQSGSPSQILYALDIFRRFAQQLQIVMLIVGQVRKDKTIAGPKKFEHDVDTVIRLTKDRRDPLFRRACAVKDRFNMHLGGKYPPIDTWFAWRMTDDGEFCALDDTHPGSAASLISEIASMDDVTEPG